MTFLKLFFLKMFEFFRKHVIYSFILYHFFIRCQEKRRVIMNWLLWNQLMSQRNSMVKLHVCFCECLCEYICVCLCLCSDLPAKHTGYTLKAEYHSNIICGQLKKYDFISTFAFWMLCKCVWFQQFCQVGRIELYLV